MKRFFYEANDRSHIQAYCKRVWPEEVKEVIHRADLACEQTFIFTHRWDMERCETPIPFPQSIDWTYRHHGDFEWTVNLNRCRFMAELGQSYWLTSDEKYATAFIHLFNDWMKQNPLETHEIYESKERHYNVKDTWRKLDSGIRITNWIKGYMCIRESKQWTEKEEALFLDSIKKHGTYLSMAYTPHDAQSNWGFLETNGLFQLAVLFSDQFDTSRWISQAKDRLTKMCALQIFEDGMHNEQSPMYHHEVLHCLFESIWLATLNNIQLDVSCVQSLERLFDASLAIVKPSGYQPMLSDSDHTDIRDFLCRGAVLFNRNDLKHQGYRQLDYESAWYFGEKGIEIYEGLEAVPPEHPSIHLKQSGYSIMRSDWGTDSHYALFDGGHMDIIRAHGHDDFLHIEVCAFGEDMLVDPGRFTYMEGEERRYFKESSQHNTTIVDGIPISDYIDSWSWGQIAQPQNGYWYSHTAFDYVQAGHTGYHQLDDPVHVLRKVLFVKPYYWLVLDVFESKGIHHYAQRFHCSEETSLSLEAEKQTATLKTNKGNGLHVQSLSQTQIVQERCYISRDYNQKSESDVFSFEKEASGKTQLITMMVPFSEHQLPDFSVQPIQSTDTFNRPFAPEEVTSLLIQINQETHYIVVSHSGPNSFQFEGCHMTGEVLFVKKGSSDTKEWVIKT